MLTPSKLLKVAVLSASMIVLGACASKIQKADVPADAMPADEIAKLDQGINDAYLAQADVLAPHDIRKAEKYRDEAKEDLADKDDREDILENVAYAQAYLNQAMSTTQARTEQLGGTLDARKAALAAGAREFPEERKRLKEADEELREASSDLKEELSTEDISRLQALYIGIESAAIRSKQLGDAKAKIQGAIDAGAKKRTPETLRRAEVDVNSAANVISSNPHNPERFKEPVAQANASAQFLYEVIQAAVKGGKNTTEGVAVQLVNQQRAIASRDAQIGTLASSLGETQSELDTTNMTVAEKEAALRAQREAMASQQQQIALQAALEKARTEFSDEEAEVYQQGDKLLIRLKSMNFASGQSDLPQESIALLGKVNSVIEGLNTSNIVVEGHTDAVGSAAINQKISQERAQSVASYLEQNTDDAADITAVGVGFQKPIASNKSKEGRQQNRRVDVIVTAGNTTATEDRTPASTTESETDSDSSPSRSEEMKRDTKKPTRDEKTVQ